MIEVRVQVSLLGRWATGSCRESDGGRRDGEKVGERERERERDEMRVEKRTRDESARKRERRSVIGEVKTEHESEKERKNEGCIYFQTLRFVYSSSAPSRYRCDQSSARSCPNWQQRRERNGSSIDWVVKVIFEDSQKRRKHVKCRPSRQRGQERTGKTRQNREGTKTPHESYRTTTTKRERCCKKGAARNKNAPTCDPHLRKEETPVVRKSCGT